MELFTIKRYDENAIEADPAKEDEILNKLMKKAQKKKRKLLKSKKNSHETILEEPNEIDEEENDDIENKKARVESDNEKSDKQTHQNSKEAKEPEFQVLGNDVFQDRQKVQMVLPPWLARPTIIDNKISIDAESKDEINNLSYLTAHMKTNLKSMEIDHLFPVQKEVIPWILNAHSKPSPFRPRDICVSAPTGSGKTLAFAIPIVQMLSDRVEKKIRALIILPVAELALQVYKVFRNLVRNTNLTVCLFSTSMPYAREQKMIVDNFQGKFYSKADIVVTTPGRLVEHLHSTKGFCLKSLKYLVIDEADRIMEQIHHNWLYHLDAHVKSTSDMFMAGRSIPLSIIDLEEEATKQPHKMLFSATLSQDPEKLQNLRLFQPKLFTSVIKTTDDLIQLAGVLEEKKIEQKDIRGEFIGKYTTPAELTEKYCITEMRVKPLTLFSLINENNWKRFLCFTNSAESSSRLAFVLASLLKSNHNNLRVENLSSTLKGNQRKSVLRDFANGVIQGLVCSDALSRGIDVPSVDIVISYDAPTHVNTYIHRIGRTARAGRPGTAVTLLTNTELQPFKDLLAAAGKEGIQEIEVTTTLEEDNAKRYTKILGHLRLKLENEKKLKLMRRKFERIRAVSTKNSNSFADRIHSQISENLIAQREDNDEEVSRKERTSRGGRKMRMVLGE